MTKNKIFSSKNLASKLLLIASSLFFGLGALLLLFQPTYAIMSADPETPEHCFEFSNGTITKYLKETAPECGTEVVIPSRIDGQDVTRIGNNAFLFYFYNITSVTIPNSVISIGEGAFSRNKLTSIIIPDSTISIEQNAFYNNQLTSATIGNSVTSIGARSFAGNQINSITIPDSVISIGHTAFYQNKLTSVTIGNSVTSIGARSFAGNQINSITIPDSVISIGDFAFGNNQLTSVTISDSVKEIESHAFQNNKISQLQLGNNIEKIGFGAFAINELTEINLPDSLTDLWGGAFAENKLTEIQLSNGLTKIAPRTFAANNLSEVHLPEKTTFIGEGAFAENKLSDAPEGYEPNRKWEIVIMAHNSPKQTIKTEPSSILAGIINGLFGVSAAGYEDTEDPVEDTSWWTPIRLTSKNTNITIERNANATLQGPPTPEHCFEFSNGTITKYLKDQFPECGSDVIIPKKINGITVHTIGTNGFRRTKKGAFENKGLTSVVIPDSISSIGERAFRSNLGITSVSIPNSVTSMGEYAFAYSNLSSIIIPNSLTTIGYSAFYDNKLTSVYIPDSITNIGKYAFGNNQLTSVVIPDSITTIESYAFQNNPGKPELRGKVEGLIAKNPNSVSVSRNANIQLVQYIPPTPEKCFEFNEGIITKYLKDSFPECGSEVTIPNIIYGQEVTTIGTGAFCEGTTPSTASSAPEGALSCTNGLGITEITLPDSVITIEMSAFNKNPLNKVILGKNLKTIALGAFAGNEQNKTPLTNIDLPDSLESIGGRAFSQSNLQEITFGPKVKTIEMWAFHNTNLSQVALPEGLTEIPLGTFYGNENLTNVQLPSTLKSIGKGAFYHNGITQVTFPQGLEVIDEYAFRGNKLSSLNIPNKVTTIGGQAFYKNQLNSLTIGNSVQTIGIHAFRENQLDSAIIPNSVTSIGSYAFFSNPGYASLFTQKPSEHTIGNNANVVINPLKLIIHYKDTDGKTLNDDLIIYGEGKYDLKGRTPGTANEYFQAGQKITIHPIEISNYGIPLAQEVTFPNIPDPNNSTTEITFTYSSSKPELVLHYTFDDANNLGRDSSGKGNHGNNHGAKRVEGKIEGAASFDGKSNYIITTNSASLENKENITISIWIKDQKKSNNGNSYILSKWNNGASPGTNEWLLSFGNSNPNTSADLKPYFSISKGNGDNGQMVKSSSETNPEKRTMLTVSKEGNKLKIYINGILNTETNVTNELRNTGRDLIIGGIYNNGNITQLLAEMIVDDLKIRNYALTPEQIKTEYNTRNIPTLLVHYVDEKGETLIPSTKHTTDITNTPFVWGKEYPIQPAKLTNPILQANYMEPPAQKVKFTEGEDGFKEITFVYVRPALVLHYTFDQESNTTVTDQSGKGNTGTIQGNPTRDDRGRVGGMYHFDGVKDHIKIPKSKSLDIYKQLTISAWIRPESMPTADSATILNRPQAYYASICKNSSTFCGYRYGKNPAGYHNASKPIELNKWTLATVTWDNSAINFYLDGIKVNSIPSVGDGETSTSTESLFIGGGENNLQRFFKGQMDDVRVYNYALTPAKVKELYEGYPLEDTSIAAEIILDVDENKGIFVETNKNLKVTSKLYKPSRKMSLEIVLPSGLKQKGYEVVPLSNGMIPISGNVVSTSSGTDTVYTLKIVDNIVGQVNTPFLVYFPKHSTAHEKQETIKAYLKKSGQTIAEAAITLESYNKSRISLYSITPSPSLLGKDIPITYQLITQTDYQAPGSASRGWMEPKAAMFYNTIGTIPLPPKAVFIKGGANNVSYDSTTHSVKVNLRNYRGWQNRTYFTVKYPNVVPGERVQGGNIIFSGMEGNTIPRQFSYPGINNVISERILKLSIAMHASTTDQGVGNHVIGYTDADFYHLGLKNIGNVPIENMEVEWKLPDGLQGRQIRIPTNVAINEQEWEGNLTLTYITNIGRILSKTFKAPHSLKTLNDYALELGPDEYITIARLKWDIFNPGNFSIPSYGGTTSPRTSFAIAGRVAKTYLNGTSIKGGDPAKMQWKITGNGKELYSGVVDTKFASKSYTPITSYTSIAGNKLLYNQGDKTSIYYYAHWSSYPYANGNYLKDPTLFFIIPQGFEVPTETIKVENFSIKKIEKIIPKVDIPQKATVYKVQLSGELGKGKPTLIVRADMKIKRDALPTQYDFQSFITLGSEDPNSQVRYGWGSKQWKDKYGLLGEPNAYELVSPGFDDYHKYKFITVAGANFGVDTCLKTDKDLNCKSMYDEENPISRSNYTSEAVGNYTITLYNASSKDIEGVTYMITIPATGTMINDYTTEWRPNLYKAIEVKNTEGAIITYDGQSNFNPNAKYIQIRIPTIKVGQLPEILISLQAPKFGEESYYDISFIQNLYKLQGDAGTYNAGMAGLRLVPDDYDPEQEEANSFCAYPALNKINPKIGYGECIALLHLYRSTNGDQRENKKGWSIAATVGSSMEAYQQAFDICGWQGIQCDNKIITSIKLPNNNLIGSLPKSFKNLKNLKQIDFSNNKLTNSIGQITQNLNTLKLNNNPLNESLDENRFKEKTNLVTLELENTNLSGIIPNSFGYSTGLATLNLSHNQLQGQIPESLTNLEHLQKLILNNNYLVGPLPALNKLSSSINNIDIRYNYIANLGGNTVVGNENSLKTDKLGNKISKYPQRQLIVAEKKFNGYSPIEKIENIKIGERRTIYIGKRKIDGYNRSSGAPIIGSFTAFEYPSRLKTASTLPASYTPTTEKEGRVSVVAPANSVGGVRFYMEGANEPFLKEGATFLLEVYPEGVEDENTEPERNLTGGVKFQGSGLNFELTSQYLRNSFSPVHFNVAGNDFGGGFFRTEATDLETPVKITTKKADGEEDTRECHTRVNGFYYNSQRGERLRPLDENSLTQLKTSTKQNAETYGNLTMQGGLYTNCQNDIHGIYGAIVHKYDGKDYKLNAGIGYDTMQNAMKSDGLRCNFQRLNNQYPFGYIYDENGHIGFVGAKINDADGETNRVLSCALENSCISSYFTYLQGSVQYRGGSARCGTDILDKIDMEYGDGSAAETMFRLGIRGIVGLTSEFSGSIKEGVEGNPLGKAILMDTEESISSVINLSRKNAEQLCRNKWTESTTTVQGNIICHEGDLNIMNLRNLRGKTIIVKKGDIILGEAMGLEDEAINIFIDQGNLYLKNPTSTGNLKEFDAFGFPAQHADDSNSRANYLKGNFVINGLIMGIGQDNATPTPLNNKWYINGKIASFNTYGDPSEKRITTLKTILGDQWDDQFTEHINLENIFKWRCTNPVSGIGSDGTPCIGLGSTELQGEMTSKAFGLVDFSYNNPLFK